MVVMSTWLGVQTGLQCAVVAGSSSAACWRWQWAAHTPALLSPHPLQVDALKQEVAEVRGCGTPHGEAAKKVSRLALERVRELQLKVGRPGVWGSAKKLTCNPAGRDAGLLEWEQCSH